MQRRVCRRRSPITVCLLLVSRLYLGDNAPTHDWDHDPLEFPDSDLISMLSASSPPTQAVRLKLFERCVRLMPETRDVFALHRFSPKVCIYGTIHRAVKRNLHLDEENP